MQNLYLFLAQPNCLVHLDLSGTDCTVDSVRTHRLVLQSPSARLCLISSLQWDPGQEPEKG